MYFYECICRVIEDFMMIVKTNIKNAIIQKILSNLYRKNKSDKNGIVIAIICDIKV